MLNSVILLGRLVKSPELKKAKDENQFATFTLAFDNYGKDAGTSFINVVVLNSKVANNCHNFLNKGDRTIISGRIVQRTFKDKNGESRKTIEIIAESVEFIEPKEKEVKANEEIQVAESVQDKDLPFKEIKVIY